MAADRRFGASDPIFESLMSTTPTLDLQKMDSVRLIDGDQELELPVIEGSEGERAIDISDLRSSTGLITLDDGFVNTGSTQSRDHVS